MLSIKQYRDSLNFALNSLSMEREYIFIERLKFVDNAFWINYRIGSCLRVYSENLHSFAELYAPSLFSSSQYAKLKSYLAYSDTYHEYIKHECQENIDSYVSYVLRRTRYDTPF